MRACFRRERGVIPGTWPGRATQLPWSTSIAARRQYCETTRAVHVCQHRAGEACLSLYRREERVPNGRRRAAAGRGEFGGAGRGPGGAGRAGGGGGERKGRGGGGAHWRGRLPRVPRSVR